MSDIGVVGLGVMGENLALNIEEKGFAISVYNRTVAKVDAFVEAHKDKKVRGASSPEELVGQLSKPRRVLMMVKAGAPVDATIASLEPHLEAGDILIDGGNELFTKTEARGQRLADKGIHYIGMGVSGGETGARHGPSLMPGGPKEAYDIVAPMLEKIAAKVEDGECVTYLGPWGAGQFVKMVHNGIEYGDMQLIAETYDILKRLGGLSNEDLSELFENWNQDELSSYLIEITSYIFAKADADSDKDLIDVILDTAKMKGTGSWTVQQAAELARPIPMIAGAVDARIVSALRDVRLRGAEIIEGPKPKKRLRERASIVSDARAALYAAKVCSYAQGMAMLAEAANVHEWPLDLSEVARIWKAGCIIRAGLLKKIQEAYHEGLPQQDNLLFAPVFVRELGDRQEGWRRTVIRAVENGIAVPALTGSLAYYDGIRRKRTPANLIAAQRDYFGAHTYQRKDKEGAFHTVWLGADWTETS